MKIIKKLSIFLGIVPVLLTSCVGSKKAYGCLETCDTPDYSLGQYYQVSSRDILETIFLIDIPNPKETNSKDSEYDISWSKVINYDLFSCVDGLEGKKINSILRTSDHVLKIGISGSLENKKATFGYIKIHFRAFESLSERTKEAYLYAKVGVGDRPGMKDKDEYKLFWLESSNVSQVVDKQCYQVRREHGETQEAEYVYLIGNSNDDFSFNDDINVLDVSLLDGVEGKRIISVDRISETVLKVGLDSNSIGKDEVSGYLRVRSSAITYTDENNKDKNLYAYVAVGETSEMVNKPTVETDE